MQTKYMCFNHQHQNHYFRLNATCSCKQLIFNTFCIFAKQSIEEEKVVLQTKQISLYLFSINSNTSFLSFSTSEFLINYKVQYYPKQVSWEETFGEPDSTHSLDCVWKYSAKCFTMWKTLCYLILTTICGIPVASCWGCYFACVACTHIWDITPSLRALAINCSVLKRVFSIVLGACIDPFCESCGKLFSAFKK